MGSNESNTRELKTIMSYPDVEPSVQQMKNLVDKIRSMFSINLELEDFEYESEINILCENKKKSLENMMRDKSNMRETKREEHEVVLGNTVYKITTIHYELTIDIKKEMNDFTESILSMVFRNKFQVNSGNSGKITDERAETIANTLIGLVKGNKQTKYRCAEYVAWAIEVGLGFKKYKFDRPPSQSAKDYGSFLLLAGYEVTNDPTDREGDVVIGLATLGNVHGHIQMLTKDGWVSDFVQKGKWVNNSYTEKNTVKYRLKKKT